MTLGDLIALAVLFRRAPRAVEPARNYVSLMIRLAL
jgi:hypothetical protein